VKESNIGFDCDRSTGASLHKGLELASAAARRPGQPLVAKRTQVANKLYFRGGDAVEIDHPVEPLVAGNREAPDGAGALVTLSERAIQASELPSPVEKMVLKDVAVRGNRRAFQEFVGAFESGSTDGPGLRVAIAHADAPDRAEALQELVRRTRPDAQLDLVTMLGPVVGTHAGPGTVGLFWFDDG